MLATVAPLVETFKVNNWLFETTFKDMTEDDLLVRPDGKGNSIQFIAGHVAASRFVLANTLGVPDECPWSEPFARGAAVKDAAEYPSIAEIRQVWGEISEKLMKRLGELTEEDIAKKSPDSYPVSDDTICGVIAFLSLHESFHMGQFSYVRRFLGYDGLAG